MPRGVARTFALGGGGGVEAKGTDKALCVPTILFCITGGGGLSCLIETLNKPWYIIEGGFPPPTVGSFFIFRLETVQSGAYLRRKFRLDDM